MAGTLNKVMLIGNLGKDPELKTFEGGNSLKLDLGRMIEEKKGTLQKFKQIV